MANRSIEQPVSHIIVLSHPEQESFNASVASAYCAAARETGDKAIVRDLYSMGFDPVLRSIERPGPDFRRLSDVEQELEIIANADVFVLVYPLWFGTPPAMLKGYVERVLGTAVTPDQVRDRTTKGVLTGKRMISITSSATTEIWLDEQGQLDRLIGSFDHYIERGFGMKSSKHHHFGHILPGMSSTWVEQDLEIVRGYARSASDEARADRDATTNRAPSHATPTVSTAPE